MRIGVPKETATGERRVALVPETVARLDGIDVIVEAGAGAAASFTDDAYRDAGATIGDPWEAEVVAKVAKLATRSIANCSRTGLRRRLSNKDTAPASITRRPKPPPNRNLRARVRA